MHFLRGSPSNSFATLSFVIVNASSIVLPLAISSKSYYLPQSPPHPNVLNFPSTILSSFTFIKICIISARRVPLCADTVSVRYLSTFLGVCKNGPLLLQCTFSTLSFRSPAFCIGEISSQSFITCGNSESK